MRRTEMIELHDHPLFPAGLRDLVTDALESLWEFGNSYKPILGRLQEGLKASEEQTSEGQDGEGQERAVRNGAGRAVVLDLCSGGGGPWLGLGWQLADRLGEEVRVCLTDRYPNRAAFERAKAKAGFGVRIEFEAEPVDAMRVPEAMPGFRTMFSSFHHFGPKQARGVLASAVKSGRGIGVFEVAQRGWKTLLVLCVTPWLVALLTPRMRPFRWSRLVWTYVVPVVPFVIWFDGLISCLRAYSEEELREMVAEMPEYKWELGEERTGLLPVTYLVGWREPSVE